MSLSGYIAITRPANSLAAGLAAVVAYLIATGTLVPQALLLFVIVGFITAAGNVINDYYDADIDAVNRADRPIPSGSVSRTGAFRYAVLLFLLGLLAGLATTPLCIGIAVFNSLLLAAYAARLKATPLAGNIAVAYLAGSMFLFGGAFAGTAGFFRMVPLFIMTFLAMMVRELLKDAEDVEGDAACGASTLPVVVGVKKTAYLAFLFVLFAVAASFLPYAWWGPWYLAGILPVDAVLVLAAAKALPCTTPAAVRASRASTILKYGMFASLVVFALAAVLLR